MAILAFRARHNSASAASSVARHFLRRSLSSACSPPFVVGLLGPAISSLIVPPASPGIALIPMLLMAMLLPNIHLRSCAAIASILSLLGDSSKAGQGHSLSVPKAWRQIPEMATQF